MKRIVVYCGSNAGNDPVYTHAAIQIAQTLKQQGIGLVYGGGDIGLMGLMADEMLRIGGKVIGVIPQLLFDKEMAHRGLTELIVVKDMQERKAKMLELADACIALPGGIGTMDELFDALTLNQLGFHKKPCGVLNINGFYNKLQDLMEHILQEGFLKQEHSGLLLFDDNAERLVARLKN